MSEAALFMAPMARKKRVSCHNSPNSYRVISHQAEGIPTGRPLTEKKSFGPSNLIGQPCDDIKQAQEFRHNRPNPRYVNFLRQDVHLLNEPVCNVSTLSTIEHQSSWWPHRTSTDSIHIPPKPLDTTVRKDFQYKGNDVQANGRFSALSSKSRLTKGIVPVNSLREDDGRPRYWKEGISYEHQYNCRLDPQYPVRAKRHGSFVWNRMQNENMNIVSAPTQTNPPPPVVNTGTAQKHTSLVGVAATDNNTIPSVAM